MNYKVVFSAEGFDHTAYFEDAIACDAFAKLIAADGRMIRVWANGKDVTEEYVTITRIN